MTEKNKKVVTRGIEGVKKVRKKGDIIYEVPQAFTDY